MSEIKSYDIKISKNYIYFDKRMYLINLNRKVYISMKEFNILSTNGVVVVNVDLDDFRYVSELYIVCDNELIPSDTHITVNLFGKAEYLNKLYIDSQTRHTQAFVYIYNLTTIDEIIVVSRSFSLDVSISSLTDMTLTCKAVNNMCDGSGGLSNTLALTNISMNMFVNSNTVSRSIVRVENCEIKNIYNLAKMGYIKDIDCNIGNIYNLSPYKCKIPTKTSYSLLCDNTTTLHLQEDVSLTDLMPYLI